MTGEDRIRAIHSIALVCEAMKDVPRANVGKVLRESIFFFWELRDGSKMAKHRRRSVAFKNEKGDRAYDHAVPLKILVDRLFANGVSERSVRDLLEAVEGVLITETEHRRLRDLGLQCSMPLDWDGRDKWCRYRAAGIELEQ